MDFLFDDLIEAVPVVICNKELRQYAPPSQCFTMDWKSAYWSGIPGYPPMQEYRASPQGYDWWFSVFLDAPGYFLLDVFYPKKKKKGCLVNVKVRHQMAHLLPARKDRLTHLSWIDGTPGLCQELLLRTFWLSAISYRIHIDHNPLSSHQVNDLNDLSAFCSSELAVFSGATKSVVKERIEIMLKTNFNPFRISPVMVGLRNNPLGLPPWVFDEELCKS